jgi:hypothetical protein
MLFILKIFISTLLIQNAYSVAEEGDWIHITKRDGIDIYSRVSKNTPIKALRGEGIIESNIVQVVSVLRNVPSAKKWVPNLIKREYVKNISDTEAILYDITNLPWPVKDRDMVMHHKLVLSPDKKGLILEFNSVENQKTYNENYVRAHIHEGKILFIPKEDGRTFVKIFMLVDPMGKIPKWVVNLLQVKMPYDFIMALDKSAINSNLTPLPGIQALINQISK